MAADSITITKLDAARRELCVAIELWFYDRHPAPIHLLAYSAYEIIHRLTRRKGAKDLLYDSSQVNDDERAKVNIALKSDANFFKHAEDDPDKSIEFNPGLSVLFIVYSIIALQMIGETLYDEEFLFMKWDAIHHPERFTAASHNLFIEDIPPDGLIQIRKLTKCEFFEALIKARRAQREGGHTP